MSGSTKDDREAMGVAAVLRALRFGEASYAVVSSRYLAENVAFTTPAKRFEGKTAVMERLSGNWPSTSLLGTGLWEVKQDTNGGRIAEATFPGLGVAPRYYSLAFTFDGAGLITGSWGEEYKQPQAKPVLKSTIAVKFEG